MDEGIREETKKETAKEDGGLIINGVELDFDLLDADQVERFHTADEALVDALNDTKAVEGLSQADQMRRQCRLVEEFFDAMFGDGTAAEVFGANNNHLDQHTDAFGRAMTYAMQTSDRINKVIGQYSPQRLQNREQRRAAAKSAVNPSRPRHMDNVKDITAALKSEAAGASERHSGQADAMEQALKAEGLTREQFEQAMALAKSLQGNR